ncbi:MarR family winged helix-turn-helix transcriptional regulator [Lacticaseibacillus kribbianus]|uniref:MarR family winged helix-turn-helix transcriptional regulator n=1 Tax=Lacticaseibacillus kribbianus TaxID=2926292 RepID=UPI001CD4BE6B|nr:MarR family winged helix-turn-helix transcriptional regulator [Lacticaseibacillus kribbianus]
MDEIASASEQISLFCRLNVNAKVDLPIRSSEMGMLIYLCQKDAQATPMAVADYFQVTKAMATNMATALVKQGYLQKVPSKTDRRQKYLVPTDQARALVATTYQQYYQSVQLIKAKLGDAQFDQLIHSLALANQVLLEAKRDE